MQEREALLNCLACFYQFPPYWGMDSQVVRWGPIAVCLVGLEALHALSCPIGASLLRPMWDRTTNLKFYKNLPTLTNSKPSHSHTTLPQSSKLEALKWVSRKKNKGTPFAFLRVLAKEKSLTLDMKMGSAATMGGSKRRLSSRGVGGVLREQRARLYIIRRCVVMLLCWHD